MSSTEALRPPHLEIHQTTLANGLRLVTHHDPATVLAAVNLWYGVGARDEVETRTGFAHLFEHLMFQGSRNVASGDHFALMEKVGALINATTSIDRTNYFEAVPVEHLDLALWLEADRMGSLDVSQENFDNQVDVVKEEKRQRYDNQPAGTFFLDVLDALFPAEHPYHHPPIGSMEDLSAATLDDVRRFHATYYGPNAAVLTVVSDLPHEDVLARVEHYFGGIPAIAAPPPTPSGAVDSWRLPERVVIEIADRVEDPVVGLAFRIPPYGHVDFDRVQVAMSVLGLGRGSRLAKALTVDRKLVSPGAQFLQALGFDGGVSIGVAQLQCRAGVDPQEVIDAIDAEFRRLVSEPPTQDELDRAKALMAAQWLGTLGSVTQRADNLSRIATKRGDAGLINEEFDGVLATTIEDVVRVAAEVLDLDGGVILHYLPGGADDATTPDDEVAA